MATIRREILIKASPLTVWEAVRDFGAVHRRLAPGFVTDTRLEGDARVVTFASGLVVRERLVGVDDAAKRLAYSIAEGVTHHNASFQVFGDGKGDTRLVWITDLLPEEAEASFREMIDAGCDCIKQTLEAPV